MSTTEGVVADTDALPTFDLDYGFDDPEEPGAVTVFAPDADDVTTAWISMDPGNAVPLEDVA